MIPNILKPLLINVFIVHYDAEIAFLIALIQLSTCNGKGVVMVCWSKCGDVCIFLH